MMIDCLHLAFESYLELFDLSFVFTHHLGEFVDLIFLCFLCLRCFCELTPEVGQLGLGKLKLADFLLNFLAQRCYLHLEILVLCLH